MFNKPYHFNNLALLPKIHEITFSIFHSITQDELYMKRNVENINILWESFEEFGFALTMDLTEQIYLKKLEGVEVNLDEIRNKEISPADIYSKTLKVQSMINISESEICKELSNRYSITSVKVRDSIFSELKYLINKGLEADLIIENQRWMVDTNNYLTIITRLKKKSDSYWMPYEENGIIKNLHAIYENHFATRDIDVRRLNSTISVKGCYEFVFTISFNDDDLIDAVNTFVKEYSILSTDRKIPKE